MVGLSNNEDDDGDDDETNDKGDDNDENKYEEVYEYWLMLYVMLPVTRHRVVSAAENDLSRPPKRWRAYVDQMADGDRRQWLRIEDLA